jgi:hypothetical protein
MLSHHAPSTVAENISSIYRHRQEDNATLAAVIRVSEFDAINQRCTNAVYLS